MLCKFCQYDWQPHVNNPVSCPRCKRRLDIVPRNIVALQIGGSVGPNDSVAMYIPMPVNPGIGVKVELNSDIEKELDNILTKLPNDNSKRTIVEETITSYRSSPNGGERIQLLYKLVMTAAGITQIAESIQKISKSLGF